MAPTAAAAAAEKEATLNRRLRALYQAQDKLPKLIDDEQFEAQSLKEYYIKLRVVAKGDEGGEGVSMKELFSRRDGKSAGRVLITGGAGLGKSTLLHYVGYRWSLDAVAGAGAGGGDDIGGGDDSATCGGLWHERFDRVLRVPLKILASVAAKHPSKALVELVREGLNAHDVYDPRGDLYFEDEDVQRMLFECAKERTLLLLDGFDEVAQEASRSGSVVRKVLDVIFNEFSQFVVTTRPNAVELLPKSARIEREIENVGLGLDGVMKFMHSFFKHDAGRGASLGRFLKANKQILDMCTIPINMALLCIVWTPAMEERFLRNFRLIDLYEQVVLWLGRRYLRKAGRDVNEDTLEVDVMDAGVMRFLKELAYDGLSHGELRLTKETLQRAKRRGFAELEMKAVYEFGLLKPEGGGGGGAGKTGGPTPAAGDQSERVHLFIHLSFQEYLAALRLLEKLKTEDAGAALRAAELSCDAAELPAWASIEQRRGSARWLMTLKFLAGLVGREMERDAAGSEALRTVFWESVSCNQDGILELGEGPTVERLMHLLAQCAWDVEKIPNGAAMYAFVDDAVTSDFEKWGSAVVASGYMSPRVAAAVKSDLSSSDPSVESADIYFAFRHHELMADAGDATTLLKKLLSGAAFPYAFRRVQDETSAHDATVGAEACRGDAGFDSDDDDSSDDLLLVAFKKMLAGLRDGSTASVGSECAAFVLSRRPELLTAKLLRSVLVAGDIGMYLDILAMAPEEAQLRYAQRRRHRFYFPDPDADSSDEDPSSFLLQHVKAVNSVIKRLPKFKNPAVRLEIMRKLNEKMMYVIQSDVIRAAYDCVSALCGDRQLVDGLEEVLPLCKPRASEKEGDDCDGHANDEEEDSEDDDDDGETRSQTKALLSTYDEQHPSTEDDDGVSRGQANDGYTTTKVLEAKADSLIPEATRQKLFPLQHLMFFVNPKQHAVMDDMEDLAIGCYRTVKVAVASCVAGAVQRVYPVAEERERVVRRLGQAVLENPASKSLACPLVGYFLSVVHSLFFLMFDAEQAVAEAAREMLSAIWLRTPLLSHARGAQWTLSLRELYVQSTDVGQRRSFLLLLEEVARRDVDKGLNAMLDLLMLNEENDMSTALALLPSILAAVRAHASALPTIKQRGHFLHRLCVVSAFFPESAVEVEEAGAAIVSSVPDAQCSAATFVALSRYGVGADGAVQRLRVLHRQERATADSQGDVDAETMGSPAVGMRMEFEAMCRKHALEAGENSEPEVMDGAASKWSDPAAVLRKTKSGDRDFRLVPCDLSYLSDQALLNVVGHHVHPHYLRTGGIARSLMATIRDHGADVRADVPLSELADALKMATTCGAIEHPHITDYTMKTTDDALSPSVKLITAATAAQQRGGLWRSMKTKARLAQALQNVSSTIVPCNDRPLNESIYSGSDSEQYTSYSDSESDDDDVRQGADPWKSWHDRRVLCPSAGAQVVRMLLDGLPTEAARRDHLHKLCSAALGDTSDDAKAVQRTARLRRLVLEVAAEELLSTDKDRREWARDVFQASAESYPLDREMAVSKLLQRTRRPDHMVLLLKVVVPFFQVRGSVWNANFGDLSMLNVREPPRRLQPMERFLFKRFSPVWSYDDDVHSAAMAGVLDFCRHCRTSRSHEAPFSTLFGLLSPPNALYEKRIMRVVTECTALQNWSENYEDQIVIWLNTARMISTNTANLIMRIICTEFTAIAGKIISEGVTILRKEIAEQLLVELIAAAVAAFSKPSTTETATAATDGIQGRGYHLSRYFEDIRACAGLAMMLRVALRRSDRDAKELEGLLSEFFEELAAFIETQKDDNWLTEARFGTFKDVGEAFLLSHPSMEKFRKALVSQLLRTGVINEIEEEVIGSFLESGMMVRLTRGGSVVVDETEYPMQGGTVERLAAGHYDAKQRLRFRRVTTDSRTAAGDIEAAGSLLHEDTALDGACLLSLLHDEGSGTQAVVLERRTAFGDIGVRTVDGSLRMSGERLVHPSVGAAEVEATRRELLWDALYGGADGKYREHDLRTFRVAPEKLREDGGLQALCGPVDMKRRIPTSEEGGGGGGGSARPSSSGGARVELIERVRGVVGSDAFAGGAVRRVNAADVLRPVDGALRTELELRSMSRRLHTTESAIAGLRDGLVKLEVSVEDANRTIDLLNAMMPDLKQLPALLKREQDAAARAAEVRRLEERQYTRGLYHEIRSQLNGVYVASQSVVSGIVANSKSGGAGVAGSVLQAISGAIPVVGSAVGCLGSMLSAVDGVQQEERLRRYVRVAASAGAMDGIAEYVARKIAQMAIPRAEIRKTLSAGSVVSEKLGDLKKIAARFLEPPSTEPTEEEAMGRQDGERLSALIVVKLQEGEALPESSDAVCDLVLGFIQFHFRGEEHATADATTCTPSPLQPRPPASASAGPTPSVGRGAATTAGTSERTVEPAAGGACCAMM